MSYKVMPFLLPVYMLTKQSEEPSQCLCQCILYPASYNHHHKDRFNFVVGLGGSSRDIYYSGPMVCPRRSFTHQPSGAEGSQESETNLLKHDRQHSLHVLRQPTTVGKIPFSLCRSKKAMELQLLHRVSNLTFPRITSAVNKTTLLVGLTHILFCTKLCMYWTICLHLGPTLN